MDCDFIAKYRIKIKYKNNYASGVIVKLDEFPNDFFVFTAKHTFDNEKIEKKEISIFYKNELIHYKLYIELDSDIVVFMFNYLDIVSDLEKVGIGKIDPDSKECLFSGYPSNVDGPYCEEAKYSECLDETDKNLYRIIPVNGTDSFKHGGLKNSKGYSGSGLFNSNNELVGIIKEHEKDKNAFHYLGLFELRNEIIEKITFLYSKIDIPLNLIEDIKNKNIVLFIGNDFSSNFGFTSSKGFMELLVNSLDDKFAFIKMGIDSGGMSNDMALNLLKSQDKLIKNQIVDLYKGSPSANNLIEKFWEFTSDIVTVNYDNLLESNTENIKIISTDNNYELPKNPNFKKLFKLHGSVEDIDNILIFEDDFKELYSKREMKAIQNYFKNKTCLFIGFSTDEVYFDWMYEAISCKNKNYIISTEQKDFTNYSFEPIFIENYPQLTKALNEALVEEKESTQDNKTSIQSSDTTSKQDEDRIKICLYYAAPLNSKMDYKINDFINIFKKYSVEIFLKTLNEDELLDSLDYDYNFLFTKTNKNKIIIEDEYFIRKSIELNELEELIDIENTILFLDEKIEDSNFEIKKVEDSKKIKRILKSFLHKSDDIKKGKGKENSLNTELPELIDRKNLNNFVGRETDLQSIIKKILTVKEENRILTIKGSGGVGKTTIISKAVVEMADRGKFEEGIKFVQCEFIQDYDEFENKISHAFDMTNALEFKKQLKEQDLDENRLIILDNIETLLCITDTVEIKELIRFISDYATIVITSREILNERDYEEVYELHKLTTDEAEELFLNLYPVKKYNKKLLRVSILENILDNNPLAIKLITKNLLKDKSLEILKEELENEDSFLDIPNIFDKESDINIERTQSLFQSINYSYTRLNDKEKLVLELLSLFPDGIHSENFKNFYKENQKALLEDKKKSKKVKLNSFSEQDIKSLEDKSLLIINNGFVMLQSIIGRFSAYKFNQRDKVEKEEYYKKAYDFNEFISLIATNLIENNFKLYIRDAIFDSNKNNFIKSLDYISLINKEDRKLIYIAKVANAFAMQGSYNEQLLDKINYLKVNYFEEGKEKDFINSIDMRLKYYYGDFDVIYEKIQKIFPINSILKNNLETSIDKHFVENILDIYLMEGYAYEYMRFNITNNMKNDLGISELFTIGEFKVAKQILDRVIEKDFFEFEFQLAVGELDINELKRHVKSIFKTQHIDKVQSTYTLLKADSESVDIKMIKKLIVVNPFTSGLKSLMFAMKEKGDNSKKIFEDAIEKLFHIKYFYVEAVLVYCRYLKDIEDSDYTEWFERGKELAEKYYYRYLLHQFLCLDSGIYTEYDEKNYKLPEEDAELYRKYREDIEKGKWVRR